MNISTIVAFFAGFFIGGNVAFIITCLVMFWKDENF